MKLLQRLITQIASNPKTSLAGITMIGAALFPKYTVQIAAVAGGIGHLLAQDSQPVARVDAAEKTEERKAQ